MPEGEHAYMESFERTGIESTLLISNQATILFVYLLHFLVYICIVLPIRWHSRKYSGPCSSRMRARLDKYFNFNTFARMILETFLDLLLSCILNHKTANWETTNGAE